MSATVEGLGGQYPFPDSTRISRRAFLGLAKDVAIVIAPMTIGVTVANAASEDAEEVGRECLGRDKLLQLLNPRLHRELCRNQYEMTKVLNVEAATVIGGGIAAGIGIVGMLAEKDEERMGRRVVLPLIAGPISGVICHLRQRR